MKIKIWLCLPTKAGLAFFIFLHLCVAKHSFAQNTFSKVYWDSTANGILANAIVPTPDNKYIIAGYSFSGGAYILKIDSAGNSIWSKKVETNNDAFNGIAATSDSNFIAAGSRYNSATGQTEALYAKINSSGNILWAKTLSSTNFFQILSVQQTYDSGYVMAGYISFSPPNSMFVAKTDAAGNLQWSKTVTAGNYENQGIAVKQAPDSSYYMAGMIADYPPYASYVFLSNISQSGNILWIKTYSNNISFNDFVITDNGILLYLNDYVNGVALAKTDFSGNIIWSKTYNMGFGNFHMFGTTYSKITKTSDSCFVFVSGSCAGSGMAKVDSSGNIIWGQSLLFDAVEPIETSDKGFIIAGNGPVCGLKTNYMPTTSPQIGVYKTDSLGNQTAVWWNCVFASTYSSTPATISTSTVSFSSINTVTITPVFPTVNNVGIVTDSGCVAVLGAVAETNANNLISVFPNPTSGIFTIQAGNGQFGISNEYKIEITNVLGEKVYQSFVNSHLSLGNSPMTIDLSSSPSGIYFLQIKTESRRDGNPQRCVMKKIIKQ